MTEQIYGISKDPWPYDYVINALLFFSMKPIVRDEYIVKDFPEILFHGKLGDFKSGDAKETVSFIWAETLEVGRTIDEWVEDEKYEKIGLEEEFHTLYKELYNIESEIIWRKWKLTSKSALTILNKLGWDKIPTEPFITCEELLNEYSYGNYGEIVGESA